ncbi:MAG: hypothetical protein N2559_01730 [Anaerolineae bacterium]|nr:hypothetical protein [Anaerolineae bacterium]
MQNKNLIAIAAGCVIVLCLCVVVAGAAVWMLDIPNQLAALSQGPGGNLRTPTPIFPLPTTIKPMPTSPVGGPTPIVAPPTPTRSMANTPSASTPSTGNPLTDFLNKTKAANKYRVEFTWVFGGMEQGKYQEKAFMNMQGHVDGKNAYFASKGGLLAVLGGDPNATIEFIQADGKSYVKGMALFGMLDPKQWYITDDTMAASMRDFANPDEFRDYAGGKDSDFKKVRTEILDGLSCDVWAYDFKNASTAFSALLGMSGKDQSDFSAIDMGQTAVWLCADGFVHKWTFELRAHDTKNPNEKGAVIMTARMWDFNNPTLVVTAPPNAKPMPGR